MSEVYCKRILAFNSSRKFQGEGSKLDKFQKKNVFTELRTPIDEFHPWDTWIVVNIFLITSGSPRHSFLGKHRKTSLSKVFLALNRGAKVQYPAYCRGRIAALPKFPSHCYLELLFSFCKNKFLLFLTSCNVEVWLCIKIIFQSFSVCIYVKTWRYSVAPSSCSVVSVILSFKATILFFRISWCWYVSFYNYENILISIVKITHTLTREMKSDTTSVSSNKTVATVDFCIFFKIGNTEQHHIFNVFVYNFPRRKKQNIMARQLFACQNFFNIFIVLIFFLLAISYKHFFKVSDQLKRVTTMIII